MPTAVQRPSSLDVSLKNPNSILYVTTDTTATIPDDSFPDGSLRIVFTTDDEFSHIEKKASGVWNDTGFRFSGGSVELGRDLTIGAAASFLETFNEAIADEHQKALIPHIPFDDTGTDLIHTPILDATSTDIIFSTAVSETTSTSIGISFNSAHSRFVSIITHEVGATSASDEVEYSIYAGTDNTDVLVFRKNLPSSELAANTTLTVDFSNTFGSTSRPNYVGFNEDADFFIELTSDQSFSLKTDGLGNPLMTFFEQHLDTLGVITENIIFDAGLDHVLDSNLDPVYGQHFP